MRARARLVEGPEAPQRDDIHRHICRLPGTVRHRPSRRIGWRPAAQAADQEATVAPQIRPCLYNTHRRAGTSKEARLPQNYNPPSGRIWGFSASRVPTDSVSTIDDEGEKNWKSQSFRRPFRSDFQFFSPLSSIGRSDLVDLLRLARSALTARCSSHLPPSLHSHSPPPPHTLACVRLRMLPHQRSVGLLWRRQHHATRRQVERRHPHHRQGLLQRPRSVRLPTLRRTGAVGAVNADMAVTERMYDQ